MRRVRQDRSAARPQGPPMFTGAAVLQELVTHRDAPSLRVTAVTFEDGAHNAWHTHSTEQVLIVTEGHGLVATSAETLEVSTGDVVLIDPLEVHWHGAQPGRTMTHLAILLPGQMSIVDPGSDGSGH